MNLETAFGKVLRGRREAASLTQTALAEQSGLHTTFVSLLERGERQPSLATLFALAKALDVEPEDLVREVRECA